MEKFVKQLESESEKTFEWVDIKNYHDEKKNSLMYLMFLLFNVYRSSVLAKT